MGKKQFIDRKNARHFHLVHRSQRDPLSRDESAPQRVLKEVIPANLVGKVPTPKEEFDEDYSSDGDSDIWGEKGDKDGINYGTYDREVEEVELIEAPKGGITAGASHYLKADHKHTLGNKKDETIGQAALFGWTDKEFNEGAYDYSQHMREIGQASDSVFVPAKTKQSASTAPKGIQFTDEAAAEEMSREPSVSSKPTKKGLKMPSGVFQSYNELTFEDVYQSAMPEGLNPDMDQDLREVLEALEDEEFVDEEVGEDFFDTIDADQVDEETVTKYKNPKYDIIDGKMPTRDAGSDDEDDDEDDEEDDYEKSWKAEFAKFKAKRGGADSDDDFEGSDDEWSDDQDRRSGISRPSASTFSMSSSAMFRNKGLTNLDEAFDEMEKEYAEDSDSDDDDLAQGARGIVLTDADFEDMDTDISLDDRAEEITRKYALKSMKELDAYEVVGSKLVPKLEGETGVDKLSTIRRAMLLDDSAEVGSVATTVGGTRRPKKNLEEDMATELQTDFRSRAERLRDSWDVQTILSTYSNLDNHPGMIKENQSRRRIHIDPKTGMPVVTEVLSKKALAKHRELEEAALQAQREAERGDGSDDDFEDEDEFSGSEAESENLGVKRNKTETKEEKKARKEAIKQEKKMRRETKKATKTAFASEKNRQEKVMKNLKKGHGVTHID
ncbi:hypothetical protein BGZ83_011868 [Gryganskiella cystojenkinii]|nr:hypothetical protein BGZ83_011868 [Gryganskiella cystojenkinii]